MTQIILILIRKLGPYIAAVIVGMAAGGWGVYKLYHLGEVRALNHRIAEMAENYQSDQQATKERYEKDIARVAGRVTVKEVLKYVKDDSICDIPPATVSVLDARLQGRSPAGHDTGSGESTPPVAVSQSQSLRALDDIGERFHACKDLIIEHNKKVAARK